MSPAASSIDTIPSTPLWRSMLFVPANVPKFVAKAHTRGADGIILDLEDSIAPAEKADARKMVPAAAKVVGQAGADVTVRINRPWRLAVRDIEAALCPEVTALILPKVEDAGHIRAIAEIVGEVEAEQNLAPGHTKLIALVESPSAYYEMRDIARAHPRLVAMTVGSEDFSAEMGMPPMADGLSHAVRESIIAARAAGIIPMGFIGTLADFSNPEAFEAMARQGRQLGCEGAFCIHPLQVAILNRAYAPDAEEIETAKKIVAAYENALAAGIGAIQVDGKMIDIPVVQRARKTLAKADQMAGQSVSK